MPISESYFLQSLLDRTCADPPAMIWRESGTVGYCSIEAGVRLSLYSAASMAGSRLQLHLDDSLHEANIVEPQVHSWFGRRCGTEEEVRVADLLRRLFLAVVQQVARRRLASMRMEDALRQRLFRRVLFTEHSTPVREFDSYPLPCSEGD